MRRIALLLFATCIQVTLSSQISPNNQTTTIENASLQKSDLIGLDVHQLIDLGFGNVENITPTHQSNAGQVLSSREDCFDAFIPVDQSTYTPVPRNDDGSLLIPNLGFTFSFCGTSYTSCYINTNGNISFGSPVAQYSPDGFPYNVPMVAPFWADVDTRNTSCEQAWYQLFPNYMIVTWEDVGWYNQQCDPLNSFQVIISDGTAGIIGVGNNIQFRYGDMEWTTGTASGGGPFGGFAATVGYNSGDNINYEQIGRFNEDNSNYDGPEGADDGVHWLDFKCFVFDASGGEFTLECNDISRALDGNCNVDITVEDIASTLTDGCAEVELSLDISSFGCANIGPNIVTVTATSNGVTETCTAIVDITNGACSAPSISPVGPLCEEDFAVPLNANPPGGTWGGAANPAGVFDPAVVGQGSHTVTYTNLNSCPTMTTMDIVVNQTPSVTINPDPAEFCENDGGIPLIATGAGGDGNYSYSWTTPFGNQSGSTIAATIAGLYTVSITDGNGCGSFEFTNVVVNPSPIVIIFDPGPICNSEVAVQLTGSPTGGVWSGTFVTPDGFIFPQNMPPGSTQVTYSYTNNFGCESNATSDITIVPAPDAIASNNGPYCEGTPIELFGSTNASGPTIYSWTGPNGYTSSQQNPTDATEPGAYLLEVTVNGCPSELIPTIVEVTEAPDALAANTGPYCPGQAITILGNTTATGTVVSFGWTGPNGYISTDQNPGNATEAGLYTLTVTVDGCPSEATATVVDFTAAPDALAENTGPYCIDDAISLTGSTSSTGTIITYTWSGPNGYSSTIQNPNDATAPGTYTLEITVDGCVSDLATTDIIFNALPEPVITGDNTFCDGGNSILDAGSGYTTYQWSTGASNQSTIVDATGMVSVTVTDVNGCTGETTYSVTENPNPVPTIAGSTAFCTGSSTILDAGGGYDTYQWSDGSFNQSVTVNLPGDYSVIVTDANGCTGSDIVTVIENDLLLPTITGDLSLCEGENSLLDAGGGFDTYLWSDGTSNQELLAAANGDYSVTVTDINGCTGEDLVTLTINTNPTPTIDGDDAICEGETASLDAGGGYDIYTWSDGSTGQNISVSGTNTFIVTVTDANGCTGETSFSLTENTNPEPAITGETSFCTGNEAIVDAGTGFDNYSWSNGETTQDISVTTPGDYTVVVTDANGCTGEDVISIIENDILLPAISGDLALCEGETSTLDAGENYDTYIWSDGSTSQTIDADANGNYSVTVTDINGCTGENQVALVINQNPSPTIDGNTAFCEGATSTLDAGNYTDYIWEDGSTTQTISVDATGTYTVTVTDNNGCTGETDINISVNPNPEPSIAGSTTFCSGFSTILDAGTNWESYEWSDGTAGSTLEVAASGTISVIVTDVNGCTGEASIDVEESTSLNPVISGDLEFCLGENTILDAGAGFDNYTWSDGSTGQSITVDNSNSYSVTVSDSNGCTGETTVSVTQNQLPDFNITGNDPFCTGEMITLDAGPGYDNYNWSDLSLNQSTEVLAGGSYSVTVTDGNGCTNEAQVDVIENQNPTPAITGNPAFCTGETVTLDAGTFDQYSWSGGNNTSTIDITMGGNFNVTVTDANGCTGEDQFTVTENQLPTPTIDGDLAFCEGTSTTLSGPDNFTYTWSNGSTDQTVTINQGIDVVLTVTDAFGCSGETSVSLIQNQNPEPIIAGSTTFCIGNSTIIDAGDYDQYQWSNGTTTQTLEVTLEGDYAVTVTDINGCTGETQTSITESLSLMPVIAGDESICSGESSIFDAGSGFESYSWSNGADSQSITVDSNGDYSVTVSDTQGCTGETSLSLLVNQNPVAIIDGLDVLCEGEISTLDAGTGYDTYLWSNGAITQSIDVANTGTFSVTVTDINNCQDETQIDVTVNTNPTPIIAGPSSFCSGNEATLDAGTGYDSYFWSNGETTQTITVNTGNLYSVTVSTVEGCTAETDLDVIENSSLTPVISGDLSFCDGDNSILDAGTYSSYEWSTGEITQTISVSENGNYNVIVTDADGCSGSTNVAVSTFQNPEPIIAGSTTFCTGSFTTLDAGNYDSFVWSNGETSQTITVNTPGLYTVDILDNNGCSGSAFIDVTESTSLNPVISGEQAICTGGSTILDAGAGFDTYLWSNGDITQTLEVSDAADFSVTVSDAQGCTGETTISIIENTPPVADLMSGIELCNTEAGGSVANLFDLIISGDNTGTWEDTDNSGAQGVFNNLNFNTIPAGAYTFTYTTNSAISPCEEVSYPVIISIVDCACPTISFAPVDPLCNDNGSLDLSSIINTTQAGDWSIISTPTGTNPATISNQTFDASNADEGDYDLEYSLTDMPPPGCPTIFSVSVTVDPTVTAGSATLPIDFCADDIQTVTLNDLLNDENGSGIWTETSGNPSQGSAFNPATGLFDMTGQNDGVYNFEYTVLSNGACPNDSESVSVIINELPIVVAGNSIELDCNNPTLSLDASGSSLGTQFDIEWSGGVVIDGNENTISPTVEDPGFYTIMITNNQTGCSATDIVEVTESTDIPNAFAGDDAELTCDDTELTLQASGNTGPGYQIEWQGPSITIDNMNDANPMISLAGVYILNITDTNNGCESSPDTVIITNNDLAPDVVIETPLSIDCNNAAVEIIGTSPNSNVSFEWFSGNNSLGTNTTVDGISAPGLYTLVVTNNLTGCSGSETVEVFENIIFPFADAGLPQTIDCYDPTITLDGSNSQGGLSISYQWSGPGTVGTVNDNQVNANLPGMYIINVIDMDNGCSSLDTVFVGQNIGTPDVNILQPEQLDCTIEEVTLDGNGSSTGSNYIYVWTDDLGNTLSADLSIDVQSIGTYTLSIQDTDNGCIGTEDVIVSQNMNVPNAVDFQINNLDCFGDTNGAIAVSGVSGGIAPYVFSLNGAPFSTDGFYTSLSPGSYEVALQDANGCEWDTIINLTQPIELDVDLGLDLELEMGDSAMIQAQINIPIERLDTIIWTPSNLLDCGDPDCLEVGFSSFISQNITATIVDENGCVDEDQIAVFIDRKKRVFIPNAFTPNGDGENDLFMIFADDEQVVKINKFIVFNRWGETVYEGFGFQPNDPGYGWNGNFRGEKMNPSVFVYLAEIEFIDGETILFKGDVTLAR